MAPDVCTPPPPAPPAPGPAELARAIAVAQAELASLASARRRLQALTERWRGGHRERFDAELATLDRRVDQLGDRVARAALALRRTIDEAGQP